jgi:hypothetical protein
MARELTRSCCRARGRARGTLTLLNNALLSAPNNPLDPGFGQPTASISSIFGTGGARSFQLGTRLS